MTVVSVLVVGGLIAGILLSLELGHRIGIRGRSRNPASLPAVHPTVEASILGLMGILIGFTFYGAASRFDIRRNLIVREANAIGTAYLRLDLLPPDAQPLIRKRFREYLHSRMVVYQQIPDITATKAALARSKALQADVWTETVQALAGAGPAEKSLVLTSLNEAIDITTDRTVALLTHPPAAVFAMLGISVIASCMLAGYTMSPSPVRDWVSTVTLALVLGVALYVILDYEFPRIGLIRIDPVDQVLMETLKEMK
jgi:hypothetical protein